MSEKTRVLICDDHEDARYALERILLHNGFEVFSAAGAVEAIERAREVKPELIFLDLMMPGMDGYQGARAIKSDPELRFIPVILLTARDSVEDITKGLESGADDYITKPFHADELLARLRAALRLKATYSELKRSEGQRELLKSELSQAKGTMIGGPALEKLRRMSERVAKSDAPVLIVGESGTGKEVLARQVHELSLRAGEPFVARNCAAFSETLLESELFGHTKGAFTSAVKDQRGIFEAADGGTLFLDELGELPLTLQPKLLRVLQEGTFTPVGSTQERRVDVRVVCATNRDLPALIKSGRFREDLYYRLNVVTLELPPLRERPGDIELLAGEFLARGRYGKKRLTPDALAALKGYSFPGNIRELQNEIERLMILSEGEEIGVELLSARILEGAREGGEADPPASGALKDAVEQLEKKMLADALTRSGWNRSDAARTLGMSRSNLLAKIESYGLKPK